MLPTPPQRARHQPVAMPHTRTYASCSAQSCGHVGARAAACGGQHIQRLHLHQRKSQAQSTPAGCQEVRWRHLSALLRSCLSVVPQRLRAIHAAGDAAAPAAPEDTWRTLRLQHTVTWVPRCEALHKALQSRTGVSESKPAQRMVQHFLQRWAELRTPRSSKLQSQGLAKGCCQP